ncbi:hypothetical protein RJ640_021590, partial [Escallonia rubra]
MADKPQPVQVLYCEICGLPPEYCEFGPDFEKCKPWLIKNAPDVYPDLIKEASDKVTDQLQSSSISDGTAPSECISDRKEADNLLKAWKKPDQNWPSKPLFLHVQCSLHLCSLSAVGSSTSKQEVKRLPGGKIKKKEKQEVIIEKVTRVKLSDASKKLGKKFATGASVVKGPTEKDQIDVQGDISFDIVDFITETWPD